jgi:hypothetical protein
MLSSDLIKKIYDFCFLDFFTEHKFIYIAEHSLGNAAVLGSCTFALSGIYNFAT